MPLRRWREARAVTSTVDLSYGQVPIEARKFVPISEFRLVV